MKKNFNYSKISLVVFAVIQLFVASCKKKPGEEKEQVISSSILINANERFQTIQGFGAATVFRPSNGSLTNDELDRLFGKGNGQLGLNILRIRIAADDNWRALELANAKGAVQRGAKILASPWSPPARFKTNNNLIGGSLKVDSSEAYARYLNDFANYMAANGAAVHAVSVQNEPDWDPNYESCVWTAIQMRDFLKNYGHLITSTQLMAPELVNYNQAYMNTLLSDNAATANIDIIGTHIYGGGIAENSMAKAMNKEVWMTEHLDTVFNYTASLATAVEIHNCLTVANFSAYIWWYAKRFYGPIGEEGFVTKRGFMMSQFAKYISPGSVRIGTGPNTASNVRISAYKTNAGKKVVVAINNYNTAAEQTFTFQNSTVGDFIPYTTTETKNAEPGTKTTATNNSFTYKLPPYSVTTFVEQ